MHRSPIVVVALCAICACVCACGPSARHPGGATPASMMPVIGPGGDPTTATDLGEVPCGKKQIVDVVPTTCVPIHGAPMSSGSTTEETVEAFDGDVCTVWNAGGPPPRFAAEDFGQKRVVSGLVIVPSIEKNGRQRDVIEASDDGITYHTMYVLDQEMESGHAYQVKIPTPFAARGLRVSTTDSTSFVAWKEIVGLECKL
jgi:hypothetical protein